MDRICTRRGPQGRRCSRPGSGFPHYIPLYRETSQIDFLPELFDTAHAYASANSSYLSSRSIPITVTGGIGERRASDGFRSRNGQSFGFAAIGSKLSTEIYRYWLRKRKAGWKMNAHPEKVRFSKTPLSIAPTSL
jgi:hypothetical protein